MGSLEKEFDKEIMMKVWHEVDCPAHSNQMKPENECNCIFKFIDKTVRLFISKREKDLLEKVEKIEIDIEMAITTNPDYLQMARDRVHALRRELSNE